MRAIVIGASADRAKFGNRAVRAYVAAGWEIACVNPTLPGGHIEGQPVFATVEDVPRLDGGWDRALLYVPERWGIGAVEKLSVRGDVKLVWFNPGADGAGVLAACTRLGVAHVRGCAILDVGPMPPGY